MTDDDQLRELARSLTYDRPDPERREAVRSELLLRAKADVPPARNRWAFVVGGFAAGLAAAAAVVLFVGHRDPTPAPIESPLTVMAAPQAELERTVATDAAGKQDERVHVRAGTVKFAVGATTAHVMVTTGDAQIEGVGTYEVNVAHDTLAAVSVASGVASVRVNGQKEVFLAAGQTWKAPVVTADLPVPMPVPVPTPDPKPRPIVVEPRPAPHPVAVAVVPPEPTPEPTPTPVAPPAPAPPADGEAHFQHGWELLRAQRYAEAAIELGLAADAGGSVAADARYFQAAALVKAGRKTEAERAYVQFLDAAPKSLRRGRAAVALARLIAERGDRAAAAAWYQTAVDDRDPDVAAAAKAGLR